MSELKYTQSYVAGRKEVTREVDGQPVTFIRFKGVLKYKEPNPDYVEKPEGEDTRLSFQKRRYTWKNTSKWFEVEKVTAGRASKATKAKRTEAQIDAVLKAWREEMEREASQSDAARQSVIEYVNSYIDLRERIQVDGMRKLEASTALDYRKSCRRLVDGFSDITMAEVTTRYVKDWERRRLEEGMSVYQVRKCHRLLHLAFENAYKNEELDINPVARVNPPSAAKKEPNSLTQEGMQLVTERLEASKPTPVVTAAYLALHAGLRCAECCALTWSDVDFKAQTLTVRGSIGTAKGGSYVKGTKSGKARTVDFDSEFMGELLKRRKELMLKERDNITEGFESLYVCGTADGDFVTPTTISRAWTAIATTWGLVGSAGKQINFHALRHSFVTAQLSTGSSPRDVADNAGHASTQMTVDTYASALRNGKRQAAHLSGSYMRPDHGNKETESAGTDAA